MGKQKGYIAAALMVCGTISTVAIAATTAEIITTRQAHFKNIAKANKAIADELKKPSPSMAIIRNNAGAITAAGDRAFRAFPAGSGPEAGVKTEALPAIWQRSADFRTLSARMLAASRALGTAAGQGNADQVRAASTALGQSCKNCHSSFRARK